MELTKREKDSIFIVFWFYIILFFVLIYYSINYLYPNIKTIENKKVELKALYKNKEIIEKQWISFNDFVSLNKALKTTKNEKDNTYLKTIIENVDVKFYNDNFINNWEWDYKNFIIQKNEEVNSEENQKKLLDQANQISKILPSYIEKYLWNEKNILTNFKFINYIESIIETFNLSTSDKIWINKIELLWDYKKLNWKTNNLEVNIFSIPLKLTIQWEKSSILNFLLFVKKVWNVDLKNGEFVIKSWEKLKTKHWIVVLKWDEFDNIDNYNLYKNQIFDIDYIKFWEYIDSSLLLRWESEFIKFINNTQWEEKYQIDIKLSFYVKWIEQFELYSFINNILTRYSKLNTNVAKKLKSFDTNKYDLVQFKKSNTYLKEIETDIWLLKKELQKKDDLEWLYNKVMKYNTSFTQIEKLFK